MAVKLKNQGNEEHWFQLQSQVQQGYPTCSLEMKMKCKRKLSIIGSFLTLSKNKLANDFHISIALINFTTHKKTHFSHK